MLNSAMAPDSSVSSLDPASLNFVHCPTYAALTNQTLTDATMAVGW